MNKEEIKSSFSQNDVNDAAWFELFNELCCDVFYKNANGVKLLAMLENKYFRSPVASPAREPSWAYFNEGRNELIRAFTHGIQSHLVTAQSKFNQKTLPRKARIKPIANEA